jgi:hypothetical protein
MKRLKKTEFENELNKYFEQQRLEKKAYIREIQFGLWEIFDGENTIVTSHNGYHEFNQALRQAVNREIKKIKDDLRDNTQRFD